MASVFAGDEIDFLEHTERTKRDVFEIAYRRRNDEERPRHGGLRDRTRVSLGMSIIDRDIRTKRRCYPKFDTRRSLLYSVPDHSLSAIHCGRLSRED
jgi:hypothetical protein